MYERKEGKNEVKLNEWKKNEKQNGRRKQR